jgi:glutaredoxin/glutathione-dependent peroxiredoxin
MKSNIKIALYARMRIMGSKRCLSRKNALTNMRDVTRFFSPTKRSSLPLLRSCQITLLDSIRAAQNKQANLQSPKGPEMSISVGDKIPDVKLVKATPEGPQPVQSSDYFAGRRIALFSVPGAFTPTCSAKHLPGFVEKADELTEKGIDEIACTAVNDAFVLGAWNKAGGSDVITMLADGNGEFASALGLEMDGSAFGMGKRGQRFSMVVNNGVVEQINVEAPGDFKVSSADYMLGQM